MFMSKDKEPNRKRNPVATTKVHSYYTPSQQERIDIDMSSRRSIKRSASLRNARLRFEKVVGVAFAVFIIYLLVALKGQPLVVVSSNVSGIDNQRYSVRINELFKSSVFNSNKLTLLRSRIEHSLLDEYPELKSAQVKYSFVGRRPEVYLEAYALPFDYEALGKHYLVSETGKNVGLLDQLPTQVNPLLIRDESGVQAKVGDYELRSSDVSFIESVKVLLAQKGRRVESIRITSVPREIYVKITDTSYQVRMYLEDAPDTQLGTFLAAEKTLGEGGEVPSQYIDVRAGEKVFWQ